MKVIIGLGNPGNAYQESRHNVGFMVIQLLTKRHNVRMAHRIIDPDDGCALGVYGDYMDENENIRLLLPLTMMNEAGRALRGLDASNEDLLLVCDDVNLPLGVLRLRAQGGSGGHNGIQSCLDMLATEQVSRLRIGIGTKELPKDLRGFVLSEFEGAERPIMEKAIEQAACACESWSKEGIESAMNKYNISPSA